MTTWRVATFNIRHGRGPDGRVDLARTAQEIAALGADVIGLQEVDDRFGPRSEHEDQPSRLAELLGMQVRYGAAIDLPPVRSGAPRRRYGIALLTRHEILSHRTDLLPAPPGRGLLVEPRAVLHSRLRHRDGGLLDVLVTHLDPASRRHRAAQVQQILHRARELSGPAVLMGDMNADPAAPELAGLTATGWREAAAESVAMAGARRGGARGGAVTSGGAERFASLRRLVAGARLSYLARLGTHPARFPLRRLDALWVRGDVAVTALEVGARGSSDHRPVIATMITAPPTGPALD